MPSRGSEDTMGLFSTPLRGVCWILEQIADRAEEALYDLDAVRAALADLYLKVETGALSEAEFERREAELVQRLEEIEAHQKRKGRP
jgi:hypothetical protein